MEHKHNKTRGCQAIGFSLIEMIIVVVIIMIVSGIALLSLTGALPNIQVNNGLNACAGVVKQGRALSVSQRRNYQLMFTMPNQIWLRRLEIPAGFTDLPVVTLPGNAQFMIFPGIPDTPDGFGNASPLAFGGTLTQTFMANDQFVDSGGAPLNGTIFIGIPGQPSTQRAITILGATGRIRAYRWTGGSWLEY